MATSWFLLYSPHSRSFSFACRAPHPALVCAHTHVAVAAETEPTSWRPVPARVRDHARYWVYRAEGDLAAGAPQSLGARELAKLTPECPDLRWVDAYDFEPPEYLSEADETLEFLGGEVPGEAAGSGKSDPGLGPDAIPFTEGELTALRGVIGMSLIESLMPPDEPPVDEDVLDLLGEEGSPVLFPDDGPAPVPTYVDGRPDDPSPVQAATDDDQPVDPPVVSSLRVPERVVMPVGTGTGAASAEDFERYE